MLPGLHSAGATAQRFADHVFKNNDTMPYLDDITTRHQIGTVHDAATAREVEQRLLAWFRRFVDQCIKFNITVNAKKSCIFSVASTILGHTVSHRSITPLQHRLDALRHYEQPHDRPSLVRFVALVRYYSDHIPALSILSAPLNHLTTVGKHFKWTDVEQKAFVAIKEALLNTAALSEPRQDRPLYLTTDASELATGYVLEQYDDSGAPRIVAMGGARHRSPAEDNYAVFELEMLALKRALDHLQPLLSSNPFTTVWRTDSQTAAGTTVSSTASRQQCASSSPTCSTSTLRSSSLAAARTPSPTPCRDSTTTINRNP